MNDTPESDWQRLLSPPERARMLDDIARVSLAIGPFLSPDQPARGFGVVHGSDAGRLSPAERLGLIDDALPRLSRAIRQIGLSPLTKTVRATRPVSPPARARRVGTAALLRAARRPAPLRFLDESITQVTADTAENRAVRSFMGRLARESEAIARLATAEGAEETARRAEECAVRLRVLVSEEWWAEVGDDRCAWTRPPTARATARPDYTTVFREMARARLALRFVEVSPLLALPPRETWRIYETWCLFTVLEALRSLAYLPAGGRDAATPGLFAVRTDRVLWTLAQGGPARVVLHGPPGRTLTVTYNQTYAQGERSLSHAMQPDITLEQGGRLWILDAKFKPYAAPGGEGEDINQMHAYRDAIVNEAGARTVAHAWCLYAGLAGTPNRPRLTYGRAEGGIVGALCLRPGEEDGFRGLCALLADWLRAAPPVSR